MQSGDLLSDSHGASWVVDAPLGRGLWGRSWSLKGEDGTLAVVKIPHAVQDLQGVPKATTLAKACADAAVALAEELDNGRARFLPALLGTTTLDDGRMGLITPRYPETLEGRLTGGGKLSACIDLVVQALHQLATSSSGVTVHGNLRPANVYVDDQGRAVLADPLVAPLLAHREALAAAVPGRQPHLPPEAGTDPEGAWDTWALCCALLRAAASPGEAEGDVPLPTTGLGRVALAELKDAAAARLKAEQSNVRFANRATTKLGAILNRGLSEEREPSPPFRFRTPTELRERLVEVDELIHPGIVSVSRILLGPAARGQVFDDGAEVQFSVNVAATAGVDAQEDVAIGIRLRDLDATGDGRVKAEGARFTVDRYPSGTWRVEFALPDVPPGRYGLEVAFAVKEEDGDPEVATGDFEVRPRPGYVPPPTDDVPPEPIQLKRPVPAADPPSSPGTDAGPATRIRSAPRPIPPAANPTPPPEPYTSPGASSPGAAAPTFDTEHDAPAPVPAPRPVAPPARPAVQVSPPPPPPPPAVKVAVPSDALPVGQDFTVPRATSPTAAAPEPETAPVPPPRDDDPYLSDYPPPVAPQGRSLPTYDAAVGTGRTGLSWPEVRERVLAFFGHDMWNLYVALFAAGLIVVFCLVALWRWL